MITSTPTTLEQVMQQWAGLNRAIAKPVLKRGQKRRWMIIFEEDTSDGWISSDLDEKVEWADLILKNWKTAHRSSWDTWYFHSKRDAEKFLTVYYLKWAE